MTTLRQRLPAIISAGMIILFAAAHWAIYAMFPLMSDDLWYAGRLLPWIQDGASGIPLEEIRATIAEHVSTDNARLANMVLVPLLLLPRWIQAIVPAVVVGAMAVWIRRFAGVRAGSVAGIAVILLGISLVLPWFENFFAVCYGLNYIVGAALAARFACSLSSDSRRLSASDIANALILGAWNEAFSLPMLIGGGAMALLAPSRRRGRIIRLCLLLLPGVTYLAITLCRIPAAMSILQHGAIPPLSEIIKFGKLQVPLLTFIAAITIQAMMRRDGRLLLRPWVVMILTASAVTFLLNLIAPRGERISTLIHLLALMGTVKIGAEIAARRLRGAPWLPVAAAVAIAALLTIHYTAVIRATCRLHRQWQSVEQAVRSTSGGPIFAEITQPEHSDLLLWRKPSGLMLDAWNIRCLNSAYPPADGEPPRSIIPNALRHAGPDAGEAVAGTSDVRRLGGWYFRPDTGPRDNYFDGRVGPFRKRVFFYIYPFKADDGRDYLFLYPQMCYFPTFMFSIERLDPTSPY